MKITDLLSKDAIKLNGIANSKQDAINKFQRYTYYSIINILMV